MRPQPEKPDPKVGPYAEGRTKSEVLLYIAENNGLPAKHLRRHISDTLDIKTRKPIDNQVDNLESDHIIYKHQVPSGDRGYYTNQLFIHKTFHAFASAHPILNKYGKIPQYMETKYYTDYVSTPEFTSFSLLNIFKTGMLQLDQHIADNGIGKVIRIVESNPPTLMAKSKNDPAKLTDKQEKLYYHNFLEHLNNLELQNTKDPFVTNYEELIRALKVKQIDDLPRVLIASSTEAKKRGFNPTSYLGYLSENLLKPIERRKISLMCRVSTSALDDIVNPMYPSTSLIANIASLILGIRVPTSFLKPVCEHDIEALSSRNESPYYASIKSDFYYDLKHNQLVKVKDHQNILRELFEEKNDEPTTD